MTDPAFGERWREAKLKELAQFDRYYVYTEVDRNDLPAGAQIIPTYFIGSIQTSGKFKFRLVAAGNHQVGPIAYTPTAAHITPDGGSTMYVQRLQTEASRCISCISSISY